MTAPDRHREAQRHRQRRTRVGRRRPAPTAAGRRSPLHPLEHGIVAAEHMQVRRLPHVSAETELEQRLQVGLRPFHAGTAVGTGTEPVAPSRRQPQVAQQGVGRLAEVVGHLESEDTAGPEPGRDARQQLEMRRDPLQHRVGDDHVDRFVGLPRRDVTAHERQPAVDRMISRRLDHLGGGVDADNGRGRPALEKRRGEDPRSASQVDDLGRLMLRRPWRAARRTDELVRRRTRRTAAGPTAWPPARQPSQRTLHIQAGTALDSALLPRTTECGMAPSDVGGVQIVRSESMAYDEASAGDRGDARRSAARFGSMPPRPSSHGPSGLQAATVARAEALRTATVRARRGAAQGDGGPRRRAAPGRGAPLGGAARGRGGVQQAPLHGGGRGVLGRRPAYQEEVAAAARAHEEALRAAEVAAQTALARAQAIRDAGIARAEAIRTAGTKRAQLLKEAAANYEIALRDAAHARTEKLKEITAAHDEALQEATVGYLEALRSAAPVPPPSVPADDLDAARAGDRRADAEPESSAPKLIVIDDLSEDAPADHRRRQRKEQQGRGRVAARPGRHLARACRRTSRPAPCPRTAG